jgi:hypothetical protein
LLSAKANARAKDIGVVFAIETDDVAIRSRPMGAVVKDKGGRSWAAIYFLRGPGSLQGTASTGTAK